MKRTIVCLLMVFVVVGALNAQEASYVSGGIAREMALGGNPSNPYLMDYSDVLVNPAWASKYADMIYSELGYNFAAYSASQQTIGFTYALSKGFSLGLSIGSQEGPMFASNSYGQNGGFIGTVNGTAVDVGASDYALGGINGYITGAGFTGLSSTNWRPIQAYTSFKMGGMTLGFAIYRVSWSGKQDYNTGNPATNQIAEASAGQTGFKLGTLVDMDAALLDASVLLRFNSADAKITPPGISSSEAKSSGMELGVNARLFLKLSEKVSLIPMASFTTFGYEPELSQPLPANTTLNSKPDKYNRTTFEGGIGTNIALNGGKIFGGLSIQSISLTHEVTDFTGGSAGDETAPAGTPTATTKYTSSVLSLPKVNIGAEFEIASWLTGRLGYFKSFASKDMTVEPPPPGRKEEMSATFDFVYCPPFGITTANNQLLSVGLGIHFGRLAFDGYLAEKWLADGPYVVSGAQNPMFGVLSMSYNFQ